MTKRSLFHSATYHAVADSLSHIGHRPAGVCLAFRRLVLWASIAAIILALQGCMGETLYMHSLDFDMGYDSPDVLVLDYQYGTSMRVCDEMGRSFTDEGSTIGQHYIHGPIPRGEFLYVKWRLRSTGEAYRDRVDLSDRLPKDMTDYTLSFFMKGPQLYVYLIAPRNNRRPDFWPEGPIHKYSHIKQYEIYPAQPKW